MVLINLSEYVLKNLISYVVQESSICVLVSVEMNDPVVWECIKKVLFHQNDYSKKKLHKTKMGVLDFVRFSQLIVEKGLDQGKTWNNSGEKMAFF
jgi:hypothetical protein